MTFNPKLMDQKIFYLFLPRIFWKIIFFTRFFWPTQRSDKHSNTKNDLTDISWHQDDLFLQYPRHHSFQTISFSLWWCLGKLHFFSFVWTFLNKLNLTFWRLETCNDINRLEAASYLRVRFSKWISIFFSVIYLSIKINVNYLDFLSKYSVVRGQNRNFQSPIIPRAESSLKMTSIVVTLASTDMTYVWLMLHLNCYLFIIDICSKCCSNEYYWCPGHGLQELNLISPSYSTRSWPNYLSCSFQ